MKQFKLIFFLFVVMLTGCQSQDRSFLSPLSSEAKGEYIYRHHDDDLFTVNPPRLQARPPYPWEERTNSNYLKITKEFFRCKGSSLNPVRIVQKGEESQRFYDCGGAQKHSLPLRDQKEFIYPLFIDLMNYIQAKTDRRVVITCGHCCPDHNFYLDPSPANQFSKHLIGAEVDFYVQGMENQPEKVIDLILNYYQETPKYKGLKEYQEFQRYTKEDTNVSTTPWYNKEIFIKLFKKTEGRDFDNRHPYPYISVQLRYDWDLKEKVNYTWDRAFRNFHRW